MQSTMGEEERCCHASDTSPCSFDKLTNNSPEIDNVSHFLGPVGAGGTASSPNLTPRGVNGLRSSPNPIDQAIEWYLPAMAALGQLSVPVLERALPKPVKRTLDAAGAPVRKKKRLVPAPATAPALPSQYAAAAAPAIAETSAHALPVEPGQAEVASTAAQATWHGTEGPVQAPVQRKARRAWTVLNQWQWRHHPATCEICLPERMLGIGALFSERMLGNGAPMCLTVSRLRLYLSSDRPACSTQTWSLDALLSLLRGAGHP